MCLSVPKMIALSRVYCIAKGNTPNQGRNNSRLTFVDSKVMLPTLAKVLLLSSVFWLTACIRQLEPAGPAQHESRSTARGKAEMVRVELHMGAGELRARSG